MPTQVPDTYEDHTEIVNETSNEICGFCGVETDIPRSMPEEARERTFSGYIFGLPLCKEHRAKFVPDITDWTEVTV